MEANLLNRLQKGDDYSFKEIYDQCHFKVYAFVNHYTKQAADTEDIVQNVFIHLWNYRKKVDPELAIDAILFKSAKQEISKWYKKQNQFPSLVDDELREDLEIITETDENVELKLKKIKRLLEEIPEKRRKIFTLHKFEQLSYKEIASEMGMTTTAVAKQISKTHQFLKENVTEDPYLVSFVLALQFL